MSYTPMKVSFFLYAESEAEINSLQQTLRDFVKTQLENGGVVTATSVDKVLRQYGNNPIVNNYFRR